MVDLAKLDILFKPVRVTKGRKFRGLAYLIESWNKSNGGYSGSGVRPLRYYQANRGVDAITLETVYFNGAPEIWDVDPQDLAWAKTMWVRGVLERCLKRCGEDKPWRRAYLTKVLGCSYAAAKEIAEELPLYLPKNEDEGNRAERLEAELEIREDIVRSAK